MKKVLLFILIMFFSLNVWAFELKSTAFKTGDTIPEKYTCDDTNISPDLYWLDPPQSTECFAIVCQDPDAPNGTFTHWVIFNIPNENDNKGSIHENIPKIGTLVNGAVQVNNDFGTVGYSGPCPPQGKPHRYIFIIYALDLMLTEGEGSGKDEVLYSIRRHALGQAQLIGMYQK